MPSPIGHLLAGAAVAAVLGPDRPVRTAWPSSARLLLACALLAALPDADLLLPIAHRSATHSLAAVVVTAIITMAVTGWVTRRWTPRVVLACTVAYATHLLLDWLGADTSAPRGIQLLWPFDDRWFISGWDVFPRIERRAPLSPAAIRMNVVALAIELLILVPVFAVAWLWAGRARRERRGSRVASGRARDI